MNNFLLSPLVEAFVGDAVFTLFIRRLLVENKPGTPKNLQKEAAKLENASAQSQMLKMLEQFFTDEEKVILRRGRNASPGSYPKGSTPAEYHRATALEALIGHLYLQEKDDRLNEIFDQIRMLINDKI